MGLYPELIYGLVWLAIGEAKSSLALRVSRIFKDQRPARPQGGGLRPLCLTTPKEGAEAAALRYAEALSCIRVEGLPPGVNIGVASYPEGGQSPDELLNRADDRMYQVKALNLPVLAR